MARIFPHPLRPLAAVLVCLQLAAPAGLLAQSPGMAQQPSSAGRDPDMSAVPTAAPESTPEAVPVTAAPAKSAQPLTRDEQYLQVLNRLTYGPRPGELERVKTMGLNAWLTRQLNPWQIDDSALNQRLADYPAMKLPLLQLMEMYPDNGTIRAASRGRASVPSGPGEKAIYNDQMARYKDKKKNGKDKDEAKDDDPAPLP